MAISKQIQLHSNHALIGAALVSIYFPVEIAQASPGQQEDDLIFKPIEERNNRFASSEEISDPASVADLKSEVFNTQITAGRTSTNRLKVWGVDPAPAEMKGTSVVRIADGYTCRDWIFQNGEQVQLGAGTIFEHNRFVDREANNRTYNIYIPSHAHGAIVRHNDIIGPAVYAPGGRSAQIHQAKSGKGKSAVCAKNVVVEQNRFANTKSDAVKTTGCGIKVWWNYFDAPSHYPEGTPTYDPSATYNTGDWILGTSGKLLRSKLDNNKGRKQKDRSAFSSYNPHCDAINPYASIGEGTTIAYNRVNWPSDARAVGLTNWLRIYRNTGRTEQVGPVYVFANYVDAPFGGHGPITCSNVSPAKGEYSTGQFAQAANGGMRYSSLGDENGNYDFSDTSLWSPVYDVNVDGPFVFVGNWLAQGRAEKGIYYTAGIRGSGVFWDNNVDVVTGNPVAAPDRSIEWVGAQPTLNALPAPPRIPKHGPARSFTIKPTSFSNIVVDGGTVVSACAVQVGGRIVGYMSEAGGVVVFPDQGVAATEVSPGVFEWSATKDADMTVSISAGSATVTTTSTDAHNLAIIGQSELSVALFRTSSLYTQQEYPDLLPGVDASVVYRRTNGKGRHTAPRTVTVNQESIDNREVSPGLVAFVNMMHLGTNGKPLRICDVTDPGTSANQLADDDNPRRDGSIDSETIAAFTAQFGPIEEGLVSWWGSEAATAKNLIDKRSRQYVGLNPDGSADTSGVFERPILDLGGLGRGLLPDTAKLSIMYPGTRVNTAVADNSATPNISYEADENGSFINGMTKQNASPANQQRQAFLDWMPAVNRGATGVTPAAVKFGDYVGGTKITNGQVSTHPSVLNPDGQILFAQDIAYQVLVSNGYAKPVGIDRWEFANNGSKITAHISMPTGSSLHTLRKLRNEVVSSPRPQQQEAMGFVIARNGDGIRSRRPVFRTDNVDSVAYPPAYRGTVAITEPGKDVGSGNWEAQVEITPTQTFGTGDRVMLDPSGAYGQFNLNGNVDYDAEMYKDSMRVYIPSLDDGTKFGYPGPTVPNQKKSDAFSGTSGGGDKTRYASKAVGDNGYIQGPDLSAFGPVTALTATLNGIFVRDERSSGSELFEWTSTAFDVTFDGRPTKGGIAVVAEATGPITANSSSNKIVSRAYTPRNTLPQDVESELTVSVIQDNGTGNAEARVFVDGVQVGNTFISPSALDPADRVFTTIRLLEVLRSNDPIHFRRFRWWTNYSANGDLSTLGEPSGEFDADDVLNGTMPAGYTVVNGAFTETLR